MERRVAKELLHIERWLDRMAQITAKGREAYLADDLLQEAGDSLMMKLGEAANRLTRTGVTAPDGVDWALAVANRNLIIYHYDQVNREMTWLTLASDLPRWRAALRPLVKAATAALVPEGDHGRPRGR